MEASFKLRSDFYPVNSRGKILDTFQNNIEKELTRLALRSGNRGHICNDNLSSEECIALESLRCDSTIAIKNSDKGGMVVIQDTNMYKAEALRQLSDKDTYCEPYSNPSDKFKKILGGLV